MKRERRHWLSGRRTVGPKLLHISTDFVFDGAKSSPYLPDDQTEPSGRLRRLKTGRREGPASGEQWQ